MLAKTGIARDHRVSGTAVCRSCVTGRRRQLSHVADRVGSLKPWIPPWCKTYWTQSDGMTISPFLPRVPPSLSGRVSATGYSTRLLAVLSGHALQIFLPHQDMICNSSCYSGPTSEAMHCWYSEDYMASTLHRDSAAGACRPLNSTAPAGQMVSKAVSGSSHRRANCYPRRQALSYLTRLL